MALSTLRSNIQAKIAAVSGVENVYAYKFWHKRPDKYPIDSSSRLHWWDIAVTRIRHAPYSAGLVQVYYDFLITGHLAARHGTDQTQVEMEGLVDDVCAAFLTDNGLTGAAESGDDTFDESGIENVGIPEAEIGLGLREDGSVVTVSASIAIVFRDATQRSITI